MCVVSLLRKPLCCGILLLTSVASNIFGEHFNYYVRFYFRIKDAQALLLCVWSLSLRAVMLAEAGHLFL